MPFGGMKDLGYGRFGGKAAINEFTELRWITIQSGARHAPSDVGAAVKVRHLISATMVMDDGRSVRALVVGGPVVGTTRRGGAGRCPPD